MEIQDERLGAFCSEMVAMVGACTLNFQEFHACRAPDFFRRKEPIVRRFLADIVNAFQTSFCPEGSKVRFASCLLKDRICYF